MLNTETSGFITQSAQKMLSSDIYKLRKITDKLLLGEDKKWEISLAVQCLKLSTCTAVGLGSIPG